MNRICAGIKRIDFHAAASRAAVAGVATLFVLVPLAWWPKDPYGLVKWTLVGMVATLAASLRLASFLAAGETPFRRNAMNLPLFLLLAWSCLSLWSGPPAYYVRWRLCELLFFALLYVALVAGADTPGRRTLAAAGALAGLAAISLLGIGHFAGLFGVESPWGTGLGRRVYATMLNPNYLADFIVGLFPLSLAFFVFHAPRLRHRAVFAAVAFVSCACLLFTVSWGGWLGWLVSIGVLAGFARGRCRRGAALPRFAALVALLFACFGAFLFANRHTVAADYTGMRTRLLYWRASWAMIRERPVVGHGLNSFQPYISRYLTEIVAADFPGGVPEGGVTVYEGNFAHNELLATWLETGLVGVALLAWLLGAFFSQAARNLSRDAGPLEAALNVGAAGGVTAMLAQGMVSYPFRVPASMTALAFLFAVVGSGAATVPLRLSCVRLPAAGRAVLALLAAAAGPALLPAIASPLRGERRYVEARYASFAGAWERARSRCREALRRSVTEPEAYDLLGEAEERCGSPGEAIEAYRRKLELMPFDVRAHTRLGVLYSLLEMEAEAERHLREAVSLERHDSAEARLRLARMLSRRGGEAEARHLLEEGRRRFGANLRAGNAGGNR